MATVTIELPDDLADELGPPEALAAQARRAFVLDLLREAQISQGKAAHLLGLTRYDILDLMAKYQILSGPLTPEELQQDLENARRYSRLAQPTPVDGGD